MKHRLLVGAGVAATAVLVTPWSAAAATSASPPASAAPHTTASATPSGAMSSRGPKAGKPARAQRSSTTQADPVVDGCNFTQTATTWTLTANCTATATISIPDGVTLNGADHTITAEGNFTGAVVTNAGAAMSLQNLTIQGTNFPSNTCSGSLTGVLFTNAS